MELKNGSYTRTAGGAPQPDNAIIFFHMDERQDAVATAREGRPIFHPIEMVEIRLPGNQFNIWDVPVTDEYRNKYPEAYAAFKRGEEIATEGTPIEQLTVLNRAQVKELKYLDILTVEQAASIPDTVCQRFMGGYKLRDLAKRYLEQADEVAPLASLHEENDRLKSTLASQSAQIDELNRMMIGMKSQLDSYAQAPRAPEYVPPGAMGSLPVSAQHQGASFGGPAAPAPTPSSLDSIPDALAKRAPGRPRKE